MNQLTPKHGIGIFEWLAREVSYRGHLLADRDGRNYDYTPTGATDLKPGSATRPFFGILPGLVDNEGALITEQEASGNLVITAPWPGQIRTVYGDHQRVIDTYYSA